MKSFKNFLEEMKNDPCWKGYEMIGKKKKNGKEVPNCVPVKEEAEVLDEISKDLANRYMWAAKADRAETDDKMNKTMAKQTDKFSSIRHKKISKMLDKSMKRTQGIDRALNRLTKEDIELLDEMPGANMDTRAIHSHLKKKGWALSRTSGGHDVYTHPKSSEHIAVPRHRQLKAPLVRGILKQSEIKEDWQKVNRKDNTDGLSQAAVNAYRRENPGSKLQTAVTEKKPTGKRAARRKSFCARMSGMKRAHASAETKRDPDSPINKALRRWRC